MEGVEIMPAWLLFLLYWMLTLGAIAYTGYISYRAGIQHGIDETLRYAKDRKEEMIKEGTWELTER